MNMNSPDNRNIVLYKAVLRAAVAVYLIYLGASIILDYLSGSSTLASWLVWIIGPLFVLGGAAFGILTWKRWREETKENEDETGQE